MLKSFAFVCAVLDSVKLAPLDTDNILLNIWATATPKPVACDWPVDRLVDLLVPPPSPSLLKELSADDQVEPRDSLSVGVCSNWPSSVIVLKDEVKLVVSARVVPWPVA